jgi:superfamily II DNA or RNA helicase|tara:strand:+ start:4267 stop:5526 length:1260 start_codon:yes stop_codon:yes gene_type:complete
VVGILFLAQMIKYRDYQQSIIDKSVKIFNTSSFVYLAMEVRTGKTLTSLGIADRLGVRSVLFITKKKAISSIEEDHNLLKPSYDLTVINYESVHKLPKNKYGMIICDEAHSMGAFPKPSKRAKQVKELIQYSSPYVILLSGTPTPESFSQMYHQLYGIPNNPFIKCKNFYAFSKLYVNVKQRKINGMFINDYSNGLQKILDHIDPYVINYTQKLAGFKTETTENILYVDLKESTNKIIKRLKKDRVIEGKDEVLLADTPAKLMIKVHQLCSGTIKFESGNSTILDYSKAEFIYNKFNNKKIAIFYKFTQEFKALKEIYKEQITNDLEEFKTTDKCIALQIVSGREGISLKEAECLVYYNIDFSATSYWQSRDRMTTKERKHNNIYWVFSTGGIEKDIYKAVVKKKDYTLAHFKRDLLDL